MRTLEGLFLWMAISLYLGCFLLSLGRVVFRRERLGDLAWRSVEGGFISHTLTIAVRWMESGHPPVYGTFEHALAGSWFIAGIHLFLERYLQRTRVFSLVVSPFVMLMLGYGIMGGQTGIEPLPPPYRSLWLWVHVTFGWITYGSYHLAAGVAVLYLLGTGRRLPRLLRRLPEPDIMDRLTYRLIVYGFISHFVMVGSGAIWAYGLWGRYWGWDPIETWSLISWIVYGINIHLRVTYGWKGRRAAWLAILSLITIIITFGGIGFIGGIHTPLL